MKVLIITADEPRNRQRFISKPLETGGHEVHLLKTRPSNIFLYRLVSLLLRERPEIIVFIGAGLKELLATVFVKTFRIPFIVRLGGDRLRDLDSVAASLWRDRRYLAWFKYKIDRWSARIFLRMTEWVIVVNEALTIRIQKQLKPSHSIFTIPQFCEGQSVEKDYNIKAPVELFTVANFRFSEKAAGVIWLIEQLDLFVRSKEIAAHFRIAGDGLHLHDVKAYLAIKTMSDLLTIDLSGFVPNLKDYYRSADVLLYRSYHDATPNVMLESKRYGLPLLANQCKEFGYIVEHGKTGLLYSGEKDFYVFLEQLLMNKELREKIGHGAIREHESKFSLKASQEKIESAFSYIINYGVRRTGLINSP